MIAGVLFAVSCLSMSTWEFSSILIGQHNGPNFNGQFRDPIALREFLAGSNASIFEMEIRFSGKGNPVAPLLFYYETGVAPISMFPQKKKGDADCRFNPDDDVFSATQSLSASTVDSLVRNGFIVEDLLSISAMSIFFRFPYKQDVCKVIGGIDDCVYITETFTKSQNYLDAKISVVGDSVDTAQQDIDTIESTVEANCKPISSVKGCAQETVSSQIATHDVVITQKLTDLYTQTLVLQTGSAECNSEVVITNDLIEKLVEALDVVGVVLNDTVEEISNITDDLSSGANVCNDLIPQLDKIANDIASLSPVITQLVTNATDTNLDLANILTEVQTLAPALSSSATSCNDAVTECTLAQSTLSTTQTQVSTLNSVLGDVQINMTQLLVDISAIDLQLTTVAAEITSINSKLDSSIAKLDELITYA